MTAPMTIISLTADNVKRLRAIHITPDPAGNVLITGANAAGKSSVLDAIFLALGGAAAAKRTPRPVRDGADSAFVTLDLGDLVVTRRWKDDDTSSLTVTSKDGARYPSPQAMLDSLLGRLSFDPLAFTQMAPKAQRAALLQLVALTDLDGKPLDLDDMARLRADWYADRTELGRKVKSLDGQLDGLGLIPEGLPDAEISIGHLLEQARAAREAARVCADFARKLDDGYGEAMRVRHRIATLEQELAEQVERLRVVDHDNDEMERRTPPEPPNVQEIETAISQAEGVNRQVRQAEQRRRVQAERDVLRRQYEERSEWIAAHDQTVAAALAAAKMPVEGLSLDDEGLTFGGLPLVQASSAEQLKVSVAVALALNPTIRVLRISDGSLLDGASLALVDSMAREAGAQVFVERVDESGEVGIVIVDGAVQA